MPLAETDEIPLFPLNVVLFPGGPLPLRIFEPRYVDMVKRCMRDGAPFGVVAIGDGGAEAGEAATKNFAAIGTSARIVDFDLLDDGLLGITCRGERRFRVLGHRRESDGLNVGRITWLDPPPPGTELATLPEKHAHLRDLLQRVWPEIVEAYAGIEPRFEDAGWVGARLAEILPLQNADKQFLLELSDPLQRLARLSPLLRRSDA
jgi:Lon protease-like protein